mmetsp:Transcript_7537/g.13890  ORF Transcript_7537/g.13890 Transcript_7537/m.13890 type:complete len:1019 (+) Transcript_7537:65-3121(+)
MPRQYAAVDDFLLLGSRNRGGHNPRRRGSRGPLPPQPPLLQRDDWLDDLPDCGWDDDDFDDDDLDCHFQDSEDAWTQAFCHPQDTPEAWTQAFCLRQNTPQARLRRRIGRSGLRWLHRRSNVCPGFVPGLGFSLPPNGTIDCHGHDAGFGAGLLGDEDGDVLACLREAREKVTASKPSQQAPSSSSASTALPQEVACGSGMDKAPPTPTESAPLLIEAPLPSAASTETSQQQMVETQGTQSPVLPLDAVQQILAETEAPSQAQTFESEVPVPEDTWSPGEAMEQAEQPVAERVPEVLEPEAQPEPLQTKPAEAPAPSQKRKLRRLGTEQAPDGDAASQFRNKSRKKKNLPRVAGAKSPVVARFAFEWFREGVENSEPNEDLSLDALIRRWMQLSDDERQVYMQMAEEDHGRFKAECEQWAKRMEKSGKEVDVNQILQQRQASLEKQLDAAHKKSIRQPAAKRQPRKQDADGQARKRQRPPPGFPQFPRTPYAFFCREHSEKQRAGANTGSAEGGCDGVIGKSQEGAVSEGKAAALGSEVSSVGVEGVRADGGVIAAGPTSKAAEGECAAMDAGEAVSDAAHREPTERKRSAAEVLIYLRTAWKNLSDEAKSHYDVMSAQDRERFRTEFETWRQQQPDEGWGDGLPRNMLVKIRNTVGWNHRPRMKQPRIPRAQAINLINKRPQDMEMGEILQCAAAVGLQEQYDEKRRQAKEAKQAAGGQDGKHHSRQPVVGLQADGNDLLEMDNTSGSLPTPQGIPSVMQPNDSVDDLLGELAVVDDAQEEDDLAGDLPLDDFDEYRNDGALIPHDDFFGPPAIPSWKETPETTGAPTVLGPQLCLDESGNFVLDKSSLTKDVTEEHAPTEGVPIQEAVSQYSSAYKKTPVCKWSDEETAMFYQALALYGTDLFLVQTFFRNKSAAQIKAKFTREMKRNGKQVEDVLMRSIKKLTKEPFERMHGRIDTSKHYVPPSSPLPGDEREAEGMGFGEEEDRMPEAEPPPPEPEYSAEDESLTTNRLMALFD